MTLLDTLILFEEPLSLLRGIAAKLRILPDAVRPLPGDGDLEYPRGRDGTGVQSSAEWREVDRQSAAGDRRQPVRGTGRQPAVEVSGQSAAGVNRQPAAGAWGKNGTPGMSFPASAAVRLFEDAATLPRREAAVTAEYGRNRAENHSVAAAAPLHGGAPVLPAGVGRQGTLRSVSPAGNGRAGALPSETGVAQEMRYYAPETVINYEAAPERQSRELLPQAVDYDEIIRRIEQRLSEAICCCAEGI